MQVKVNSSLHSIDKLQTTWACTVSLKKLVIPSWHTYSMMQLEGYTWKDVYFTFLSIWHAFIQDKVQLYTFIHMGPTAVELLTQMISSIL